jgi:hypothetical protein
MRARIYKPARTAMSSGTAKTREWVLEFAPAEARKVDPLMGWTSSGDTQAQVKVAVRQPRKPRWTMPKPHGIEAQVIEPKPRKPVIRPGGYGENFATNRAWRMDTLIRPDAGHLH